MDHQEWHRKKKESKNFHAGSEANFRAIPAIVNEIYDKGTAHARSSQELISELERDTLKILLNNGSDKFGAPAGLRECTDFHERNCSAALGEAGFYAVHPMALFYFACARPPNARGDERGRVGEGMTGEAAWARG